MSSLTETIRGINRKGCANHPTSVSNIHRPHAQPSLQELYNESSCLQQENIVANSFQDITQVMTPLLDTFPPQLLSATGAGQAVNVADVGTDRINAYLHVGDATALTSLAVKMQAAIDDGSGSPDAGSWVDITDATFTTITTDPSTTGAVPEGIVFQLPPALTISTAPYIWVRAYATLVGTSINICVPMIACRKYDQLQSYQNSPGNNNVIN